MTITETPNGPAWPATRTGLITGGLLLAAMVFAVYWPILPGAFLMDDWRLIGPDNALVNGGLTLRSLWFQTDFTLATLGWWLEGLAFGNQPGDYHLVNLLLQAASAVLLWRLLARLKIPGAWLAAALFAVHPVAVCTVARIAELKNTLALPFYLLSLTGYLRYEAMVLYPATPGAGGKPADQKSGTLWLTVSLVSFVLALLAKTAVVMLPVLLLLCALWQRRRITARDLWHLSPFFVLSLAFGLMSVWFQRHQALLTTHEVLRPAGFPQRLATAGYVGWFYLGKALCPLNLSVVYSQWKVDPASAAAYLPDGLAVAAFAVCWWFRQSWGWHALFGLGCFAAALFPALGFFDAQFMTRWQVSDHLAYIPLLAIPALVAAALAVWLKPPVYRAAAVLLLLALGGLSCQRAKVFSSEASVMRETIAKNPAAWPARTDLGVVFARQGRYAEAIAEFQRALQDQPDSPDIHRDLGRAYLAQGNLVAAEAELSAALKLNPLDPLLQRDYADIMKQMRRGEEAREHLVIANALKPEAATLVDLASVEYLAGNPDDAARHLRVALALAPDDVEALKTLAWLLATSPLDSVADGAEAVRDAQHACQLTGYRRAELVGVLAAAYAGAGQFPQAIAAAQLASRLATQSGDAKWAAISSQFLASFQAGKPWRD